MTADPQCAKLATIEAALNDYNVSLSDIGGCGNHGCYVDPPKGMGTNAGCNCWRNHYKAQRAILAGKRLAKVIQEVLHGR